MLYNELMNIKHELSKHHRDKNALLMMHRQARVNKSLKSYYNDLSKSASYLENRNPTNVVNKL